MILPDPNTNTCTIRSILVEGRVVEGLDEGVSASPSLKGVYGVVVFIR
ncbi:hypothetical protein RUM8411_01643 [Ruegeria meonggei]|uniref:Uncharacterized protein n=1 Tax=Ruegeria meonggei TaxID=1446476 RepID=A0A1X6Z236_9RHOB|nr:hypothetical protein RUM8411_01643 [Ruegeria meonggei]